MKLKKLFILIAVLALIIVASFIKKASIDQREAKEKQAPPPLVVTQEISKSFVSKLLVIKGTEEATRLSFSKNSNGEWSLDNYFKTRAKKQAVEELLNNLSNLKGELYSESKDVLGDYSLLESQAYHLELQGSDGKALAHVLVSPLRTRGTKNFVRDINSNKVAVTGTDLLTSLKLYSKDAKIDYKAFVDYKVVTTETGKIQSFEIDQPGATPFLVNKKEDSKDKTVTWVTSVAGKETTIDTAKVNEFLSSLLNLYGNDIVNPTGTNYGLNDKTMPWIKVHLKPEEKPNEIDLYLGTHNESNKASFVKSAPDGQVYEVSNTTIESLQKKNSEFFLSNPTPAKKS